jgi:hypothetical protein
MEPRSISTVFAVTFTCWLLAACAPSPPRETHDGLVLVPDTPVGEVYRRPGADLSTYGSIGLEHCTVAFRKNWQRDQNSSRMDLSNRVTQKDVDRIKDTLSADCDRQFRSALEQPPPYQLVDSFDGGEAVLVLRPSIINLDISAPDIFTPGMTRNYTTDAGEMTLLLEGLDGTTGEILFRVVDRQRALDTVRLRWTNSVTNQAEANRILRRWAAQLRKGLDQVTSPANNSQ